MTDQLVRQKPRIPVLTPDIMTADQRRVHDAIVSGPRGTLKGPLMAALHRPDLADRWQEFGKILRYESTLPKYLSELAILITARRKNCALEWHFHESEAIAAELPVSVIDSVRRNVAPASDDPAVMEVYDYCSELHETTDVGDTTYSKILKRWGTVGVVELTAIVGYYTLVAMTLNAHRYPLPDDVEAPFSNLEERAEL